MQKNETDPFGVSAGARKLAIDTVLKALIEHAARNDPTIKDRIVADIDVYLEALPESELEAQFAKWTRDYIAALVQPGN
jgi:hypothetical protein